MLPEDCAPSRLGYEERRSAQHGAAPGGCRDGTGSVRLRPARAGAASTARSGVTQRKASTLTASAPAPLAREENAASRGARLTPGRRCPPEPGARGTNIRSRIETEIPPLEPASSPAKRATAEGAPHGSRLFRKVGTVAACRTPDIPEQWRAAPGHGLCHPRALRTATPARAGHPRDASVRPGFPPCRRGPVGRRSRACM